MRLCHVPPASSSFALSREIKTRAQTGTFVYHRIYINAVVTLVDIRVKGYEERAGMLSAFEGMVRRFSGLIQGDG